VQRFRGGLVSKAHRLCATLNSRLGSNKEEEKVGLAWGGAAEEVDSGAAAAVDDLRRRHHEREKDDRRQHLSRAREASGWAIRMNSYKETLLAAAAVDDLRRRHHERDQDDRRQHLCYQLKKWRQLKNAGHVNSMES